MKWVTTSWTYSILYDVTSQSQATPNLPASKNEPAKYHSFICYMAYFLNILVISKLIATKSS